MFESNQHAVIFGSGTLANEVANVCHARNIATSLYTSASEPITSPAPSMIFNVWFPEPGIHSANDMSEYPRDLLQQNLAHAELLASHHASSAIINFAFLPAIYVGTSLEDHASTLRGGITGVTRTVARKFGKRGVRITCVQAGLVNMPETNQWVSDAVRNVQVPCKRWATPQEVAKFLVFLAADSLYTTGQTMIIDGGLTAGITGT